MRCTSAVPGRRARICARHCVFSRVLTCRRWASSRLTTFTCSWRHSSSPWPIETPITATRTSSTCRWRRCCRMPTPRSAGRSSTWRRRRWRRDRATPWRRLHFSKERPLSGRSPVARPPVLSPTAGETSSSATPSANVRGGAGAAGVTYGNRLVSLNTTAGHPNCIAAGKRPRITLTPTLVLKNDRPILAISVAGGDHQDQAALNLLVDHIDFGMPPAEAVHRATLCHITSRRLLRPEPESPGDLR